MPRLTRWSVLALLAITAGDGCRRHAPRIGSIAGTWKGGSPRATHEYTFEEDGTYEERGSFFGITVTIDGEYVYDKGELKLTPSDVKATGLKAAMLEGLKTPRAMKIDFTTPDTFFDPEGMGEEKGSNGETLTRQ